MKKNFSILILFLAVTIPGVAVPPVLRNAATTNTVPWVETAAFSTNRVYVDVTNGVDSAGMGSLAAPYKTIYYAVTNSTVGSEIVVKPGLYRTTINNDNGGRIYTFAQGAIVAPATVTSNGYAVYVHCQSQQTNSYVKIRGQGIFVNNLQNIGTVTLDNGDLDFEAAQVINWSSVADEAFAFDVQGDNEEAGDARVNLNVAGTMIRGRISVGDYGAQPIWNVSLQNCRIITTNLEPFATASFPGGGSSSAQLFINLSGVESRCPQTNGYSGGENFGMRFFGELVVNTNLNHTLSDPGVAVVPVVQYFDKVLQTAGISTTGGASFLGNKVRVLTAGSGTMSIMDDVGTGVSITAGTATFNGDVSLGGANGLIYADGSAEFFFGALGWDTSGNVTAPSFTGSGAALTNIKPNIGTNSVAVSGNISIYLTNQDGSVYRVAAQRIVP